MIETHLLRIRILWFIRRLRQFQFSMQSLLVLLTGLGIGLAVSRDYFLAPYQADCVLLSRPSRILLVPDAERDKDFADNRCAALRDMLTSPAIIQRVLKRPDVANIAEIQKCADPAKHLAAGLSVEPIRNSNLISVRYESAGAASAAAIVNAFVEEHFDFINDCQRTATQNRVDPLLKECEVQARKIAELRAKTATCAASARARELLQTPDVTKLQSQLVKTKVDAVVRRAEMLQEERSLPTASNHALEGNDRCRAQQDAASVLVRILEARRAELLGDDAEELVALADLQIAELVYEAINYRIASLQTRLLVVKRLDLLRLAATPRARVARNCMAGAAALLGFPVAAILCWLAVRFGIESCFGPVRLGSAARR